MISREHYDAFVEEVKGSVVYVGERLTDPDDDWYPQAFAMCAAPPGDEQPWGVGLVQIDPRFMNTAAGKQALCRTVLPGLLRQVGAVGAAFVQSVWTVRAQDDWPAEMIELREQVAPMDHPWRSEEVQLLALFRGDRDIRNITALIERDDRRVPWLQEWSEEGTPTGIFCDALRAGVGS